jgi:hypothetical protein
MFVLEIRQPCNSSSLLHLNLNLGHICFTDAPCFNSIPINQTTLAVVDGLYRLWGVNLLNPTDMIPSFSS